MSLVSHSVSKHLLVAYWGQNSAGVRHPDNPERELKAVCAERSYDIIVIGFVVTFIGLNNKGEYRFHSISGKKGDNLLILLNLHSLPKDFLRFFKIVFNTLFNVGVGSGRRVSRARGFLLIYKFQKLKRTFMAWAD